ncbi:UNVERIFIED_CONTAM: co-chaperone HscB, partial [Salmonella enterica subsp. enterica serovar Weltevreden]
LDDAQRVADLVSLESTVQRERAQWLARCATALDEGRDPASAVEAVRALMFVDRFLTELDRKRERLEA